LLIRKKLPVFVMKAIAFKQLIASAAVLATTLWSQTALAATAPDMYLQSVAGPQVVGPMLLVNVGEDSGSTAVNTVTADITYPADKLDMRYVNITGSAFQVNAEQSSTTGHIHIQRSRYGFALTGSQHIATITFVARTTGPVTLTYDTTSAVMGENGQSIGASLNNLDVTILPGGNFSPSAGSTTTVATVSPTPAATPSTSTTTDPAADTSGNLPKTGAAALGGTLGVAGLGGTSYAYMRSKRRLKQTQRQS
jgi:hypothetical protein